MALKSLTEICLFSVIDNIDLIGDVGDTDFELLRKILLHCNVDQLQRIEDATEGRDLTPITDELWRRFYARKYGAESMATVERRMKKRGLSITWRALYDAKLKEQEETQQRCVNRLKELYLEAKQQKQSRQVQLLNIVPSSGRKRKFTAIGGPERPSGNQSGATLLKKARVDFSRSQQIMGYSNSNKRPPVPPPRAMSMTQFRSGPSPSNNKVVSRSQPVSQTKTPVDQRPSSSSLERPGSRMGPSKTFSDTKPSVNRLRQSGCPLPSPPPPPFNLSKTSTMHPSQKASKKIEFTKR